jgi:hypothetical protein
MEYQHFPWVSAGKEERINSTQVTFGGIQIFATVNIINGSGAHTPRVYGKPPDLDDGVAEVYLLICITGKKRTLTIKTNQQMPESTLIMA